MKTLAQRFDEKFTPEPMSGCWLWFGAVNSPGYGKIWDGEKVEMAHRMSYRLFVGDIPLGLIICHRCDNPACVNPEHLFPGTMKDNSVDCVAKGRNFVPREEQSTLNQAQVEEIRSLPRRLPFGSAPALAAHYGLSVGGMYKVRNGSRWGHV